MSGKHLLIIDQIANGGAEKVLLDYCDWLKERGEKVIIFSLYKPVNYQSEDLKWGLKKNIDFIPAKLFQQISLFIQITFLVFQYRPAVIFSLLERSNLLNTLVPYRTRKIISVRNQLSIQYNKLSNSITKHIAYRIIKIIYNKSQCILAVSENVKNDLIQEFQIKPSLIKVINNGVNRKKIDFLISEQNKSKQFDHSFFNILSIGRLSLQKAHWKLIKAMHFLVYEKKYKNIKLTIVGSGELFEEFNNLITQLKLNEFVDIIPFNNNPYLLLKNSDLFVLPSLYEGFPNVLAEAIYLEKPFIGSDAAIPVEIFNDKKFKQKVCYQNTKLAFDPKLKIRNDEVDLALLIEKVIEDKSFTLDIIQSTVNWNKTSSRTKQFEKYFVLSQTNVSIT